MNKIENSTITVDDIKTNEDVKMLLSIINVYNDICIMHYYALYDNKKAGILDNTAYLFTNKLAEVEDKIKKLINEEVIYLKSLNESIDKEENNDPFTLNTKNTLDNIQKWKYTQLYTLIGKDKNYLATKRADLFRNILNAYDTASVPKKELVILKQPIESENDQELKEDEVLFIHNNQNLINKEDEEEVIVDPIVSEHKEDSTISEANSRHSRASSTSSINNEDLNGNTEEKNNYLKNLELFNSRLDSTKVKRAESFPNLDSAVNEDAAKNPTNLRNNRIRSDSNIDANCKPITKSNPLIPLENIIFKHKEEPPKLPEDEPMEILTRQPELQSEELPKHEGEPLKTKLSEDELLNYADEEEPPKPANDEVPDHEGESLKTKLPEDKTMEILTRQPEFQSEELPKHEEPPKYKPKPASVRNDLNNDGNLQNFNGENTSRRANYTEPTPPIISKVDNKNWLIGICGIGIVLFLLIIVFGGIYGRFIPTPTITI
ncbi:hypothetical protein NEOKW01_1915 [Nematocida sp. AWRm80]|nr:hypothetical protein NEOKW01_1915 [Nematocida sp. AWRm80]